MAPPYERRDIRGGAIVTTLASGINSGDLTFTLSASTGWPDGSAGDFFVVIDKDTAAMEVIRCASRTGTTVTVQTSGRGSDGTSAAAHSSSAPTEHCSTAVDDDEANYVVSETVGKITATGALLVSDGVNSMTELAIGTTGLPLVAGASSPSYTALGTSGIADDAVTSAKIVASGVGSSEIADGAVGTTELADQAVTTAKLLDLGTTTGKIADSAVTSAKIADATIATADIALLAVDSTLLAANAVTTAKITDANVTTAKLLDANVTAAKLEAILPRGSLGYATQTSSQTGITTVADLSGLSTAVTVGTGRLIRITGYAILQQLTANATSNLFIREGSTQIQSAGLTTAANGFYAVVASALLVAPTVGAHTYKLSIATNAGTIGTVFTSTQFGYILVEDLGAS